jgi:tetratricopeptide (TPR) repeat protein
MYKPAALSSSSEPQQGRTVSRFSIAFVILGVIVAVLSKPGEGRASQGKSLPVPVAAHLASISIDYPVDGSIFPPEITPPTFMWRDDASNATHWRIDISFTDGTVQMHLQSAGERLSIGEIDPRCISSTNELPKLTPDEAAAHTWRPVAPVWEMIKNHSVAGPAVVTINGFAGQDARHAVSSGRVIIYTSKDPVGAPIFYRDVPLMPSETEKGIIKPLAPAAIRLIEWRLRDIGKTESRVVLKDMVVCANCHSFSRDGKTMGMDMDGPQNDKGLYAVVPIKPQMTINASDMVTWNPSHDRQVGLNRVGFMSQVSPDGKYVLTTVNPADRPPEANYYVVNFKDYRFLQVFYPTRGVLAWYSREDGQREPLPGADDPRYVQTDGVWSPDGSYVVFARAEARQAYPSDGKMAAYANDPNEVQIQYDLYRVPFNGGKGGQAEAIAGASRNSMSNTFPKVSPDGRWIVFVKCRNAQLMRPDSQLWIVPAAGGEARRMRSNTPLMNSWHSFSPNGRWLVFSSKARSPYTQMYLTHIDGQGNDSPAILVDNATAANRAVNLPEFVNIPPDGIVAINTPAVDMYKKFDRAAELGEKGQYQLAIAEWRELLVTNPDDARVHNNLGTALEKCGRYTEAIPEFEKALELNPQYHTIYYNLGRTLLAAGRPDEAIRILQNGLRTYESDDLHTQLGLALASKNRVDEAKARFDRALEINPNNAIAHFARGVALAYKSDWDGAIAEYKTTLRLNPQYESAHIYLGAALRQKDDWDGAIAEYREALKLNPTNDEVHATLGATLGSKRDWDGEVREEREAERLNPKNSNAHVYLGSALGEKGDWQADIAEQREALVLEPTNVLAHASLGYALGKRGDSDGEIGEYREALRLNPNDAGAHYLLGFALERQRNSQEALEQFRAAYQLNPLDPDYRKAYERLLGATHD